MESKEKKGSAIKEKLLLNLIEKSSLESLKLVQKMLVEQGFDIFQATQKLLVEKKTEPEPILKLYELIKRHPDAFSNETLTAVLNYLKTYKN